MAKKMQTKRIKAEKYHSEEQLEAIRFIKILIIVIVLVIGIYFLTRIFVTKDLFSNKDYEKTVTAGEINYNTTIIGAMLNRPENDYYVMMYDYNDLNAIYYYGLVTNYKKNENALPVYLIDLSNELNKKYVTDGAINVNTTNLDNFKVGSFALIKVSNQKIVSALTNEEDIAKELAQTSK